MSKKGGGEENRKEGIESSRKEHKRGRGNRRREREKERERGGKGKRKGKEKPRYQKGKFY